MPDFLWRTFGICTHPLWESVGRAMTETAFEEILIERCARCKMAAAYFCDLKEPT